MSTAMAVYTSGSGLIGRCDAKCHEATDPACDCICGGKNHALGSSQAAIERQTADWFGSLEEAEKWAKANQIERPLIKAPGLKGRRSLKTLLQPVRAEQRRRRRLGIVPGQQAMPGLEAM